MKTAACRLLCCGLLMLTGCSYHANRLAGAGAMTGAIAGAAIGKDPKAAALGSVIGGVAGATVGKSLDENERRNEAFIAQQMGQVMEGAVTNQQIVAMSQAGLSDAVIQTHIGTYGVATRPSAHDLIALRQAGVSDGVLQSLQTAGQPVLAQAPVIVEERVIQPVVHVPVAPFPVRPRRACRPRGTSFHWGFSMGK